MTFPLPHLLSVSRIATVLALAVCAAAGGSARAAEAPAAHGVQARTTATHDLAGLVIVLDPGHNGGNGSHPSQINRQVFIGNRYKACDTAGTSTNDGYPEHAFTWDVAQRVKRLLVARGADVRLTHPDDHGVGPCITQRAQLGNRAHAVVALSIHADGGPASGHGFHVIRPSRIVGLTDDIFSASRVLATQLRNHLRDDAHVATSTYIGLRGIDVRGDLGGLNMSNVPKCFVELGNMRNAAEARNLRRASYRQQLARVLASTLGDYAKAHAPA